jgi:hypothetical protein
MSFSWMASWPKLARRTLSPRACRGSSRPTLRAWLEVRRLEDRCVPASLTYSIDGTGNNPLHPAWGSTDQQLLRAAPAAYADGISAPAGANRPSARAVSNAVSAHVAGETKNNRDLSAYIYVWGQFLDHDLDLTQSASPAQPFDIPVPSGDPYFDPAGTGTQVIPLDRSVYDPATGVTNARQQINQITAWIDGSMIYGSDAATAASLRTFSGGQLKTSAGNRPPTDAAGNYLAGDVRANENVELTSMQTLFLREHNRIAAQIATANPSLSDEQVYQQARAQVIAEIQVITYTQWLPALLGPDALRPYLGYNPTVNPEIKNEFSTAAFRLHTMVNDDVEFFDNSGNPITFTYTDSQGQTVTVDGQVQLKDAFFNPTLFRQAPIDGIYKYAASTLAEETDPQLVDSLRNFLFGQPGQGGLDLAALNIQRGRDHGLADYNTVRAAYGLPRVKSFADITSDTALQAKLQSLYGNVNNIDLWVGLAAEDHAAGASVGPTAKRIIADQFERLRDGDRLWYQRIYSGPQLAQLERTTLADVIERNTGVTGLQNDVFLFQARVQGVAFADLNGNGRQDRGEPALPGVTVELLNDAGDVLGTTRTDRFGHYSLDEFGETGDYHVKVVLPTKLTATTSNPADFHIATGDQTVREDFGVRLADRSKAGTPAQEIASILAALADDWWSGGHHG